MNLKKTLSAKFILILYMSIAGIYFITRLLFLDADLPPWGIINYQPVDEGTYSMMALNLYNYGDVTPVIFNGDIEYIISPHLRTNIIGNTIIYISLKLFGDNYWGLRVSSVICGAIILLIFFLVINALLSQYKMNDKTRHWVNLICLFYFMLDFDFIMACRVVENSIYRLLFLMLIIFLFVKINKKVFNKFMFITTVATLSVFGVYITNVFIYLAIFITLIGYGIKYGKRTLGEGVIGMICGGIIGLIPLEIYYIKVWNTTAIKNLFDTIEAFSSQAGYTSSFFLRDLLRTSAHFLASNVNLYNIAFLGLLILSVPFLLYLIVKKKDLNVLFFSALIGSLYLQTLFSEDYIVRKYIILYPVYFILLCIIIAHRTTIQKIICEIVSNTKTRRNKFLIGIYTILTIVICITIIWFRFCRISDGTINDFSEKDIIILSIIGIISLILAVFVFYNFIQNNRKILVYFVVMFICSLSGHLYLEFKYIYINPTYTEKQCMIDIGKTVGDEYVIGSFFPMGYTLYNDIKPVITSDSQIASSMEKHNELWCLDYTDTNDSGMKGHLAYLFEKSKFQLKNYQDFHRNFSTFGISRDVALYKIDYKNSTGD